jgi:hypothetical protein
LTAPSRDGGRDAYGFYKLDSEADPIRLDFALEAKCYDADNGVGVRERESPPIVECRSTPSGVRHRVAP